MMERNGSDTLPAEQVGSGFLIVLAILLMVFPATSRAQQPLRQGQVDTVAAVNIGDSGFMSATMNLFQQHVSPIDGDRCPMYPSCSQYSREAFSKHGFFMGWVMTCDRLLRCGRDERSTAPRIIIHDGTRYYDSIEDNDFWWGR